MSKSVELDETAHELSHLDLCCLQKPIIVACGSERVNCELGFVLSKFVFILYLLIDGNGAHFFFFFSFFYCHFMWNYVILTGVHLLFVFNFT